MEEMPYWLEGIIFATGFIVVPVWVAKFSAKL